MSIEAIAGLLEAKQAQAEAKRREAELLEAEARGLQLALDALRQNAPALQRFASPSFAEMGPAIAQARERNLNYKRAAGGRQPGALSNKWKRHLLQLRDLGDTFTEEAVSQIVLDREKRVMKPSEVRRLFENFIRHGHVLIDDRGEYRIPEDVAIRFRATLGDDSDSSHDIEDIEEEGQAHPDIKPDLVVKEPTFS